MNQVNLEGEIVRSRKSENKIQFDIKVGGNTFYCKSYDDMYQYEELKPGEKVGVVGRLAKPKFDGGNLCFVIAEHIYFL